MYQKKKIGDFLTRNKTRTIVEDDVLYKQVTIRTHYKGVHLRGKKMGSSIGTKKQFLVTPGQFILSRIDARHGAFGIVPDQLDGAIVTNDFWAFDLNEELIDIHFFYNLIKSPIFLEACIKASRGVTNRKRIQEDFFLGYEISIPSLDEQKRLTKKILSAQEKLGVINEEISHQQTLLTQLKQAILQEAIQGKLTAEWRRQHPEIEPASELLERIKAEKERLIQEGKIKKQKPLPPITEEEKSFELPEGWVWCRLGEVIYENPRNGYSPQTVAFPTDVKTLKLGATTLGYFRGDQIKYVNEVINHDSHLWLNEGDILIQRSNSLDYVGVSAIYNGQPFEYIYPDLMIKIKPSGFVSGYFLHKVLLSKPVREYYRKNASGAQKSMPKINQRIVLNTIIPFPPREEQDVIFQRINKLDTKYNNLESLIIKSQVDVESLMQAVLQEAFTKNSKQKVYIQ